MSPRGRLSRKQREAAAAAVERPAGEAPAPEPREIAEVRALQVAPAEAGERLDKLVAARLPDLSRARVRQLIDEGLVLVEGAPGKPADRPRAGSRVEVRLPALRATRLTPVALGLRVLFEDAHLVVIDKPAGISVHPGAGAPQTTLVHGLLSQIEGLAGIGGELRPGIVHRLDKHTSGCLVVAKSEPVLRGLQARFAARTVDKRYLALVHGQPEGRGSWDTAYGRHPTDRKRFTSKVAAGKRAVTRWRVLARAEAAQAGGHGAAWVEVELLTGRTHQIRAHFADAGHPLLADAMYGGTRREARLPEGTPLKLAAARVGRQALHAARLSFEHPVTGARVECVSPLPDDLRGALALLGIAP